MDILGLVRCYDQSKEHSAYRVQRRRIDRYKSTKDSPLEQAGIYLMIERHARNDLPRIYVGQGATRENGTGMLSRVKAHRNYKWREEGVLRSAFWFLISRIMPNLQF